MWGFCFELIAPSLFNSETNSVLSGCSWESEFSPTTTSCSCLIGHVTQVFKGITVPESSALFELNCKFFIRAILREVPYEEIVIVVFSPVTGTMDPTTSSSLWDVEWLYPKVELSFWISYCWVEITDIVSVTLSIIFGVSSSCGFWFKIVVLSVGWSDDGLLISITIKFITCGLSIVSCLFSFSNSISFIWIFSIKSVQSILSGLQFICAVSLTRLYRLSGSVYGGLVLETGRFCIIC